MRASTVLEAWVIALALALAPRGAAAEAAEPAAAAPGGDAAEADAQAPAEDLPDLDEDGRSSFFFRGAFGLGYGAINASDDTALPPLDQTFHGWSIAPSFAVGTRTRPKVFLHATAWFGGVTDGDARFYRPGMRIAAAGLGFTYYFMPSRVYITGTPGISVTFFRRSSGEYDAAALGFGALIGVGRDFVLRNGWTLGCALEGRMIRSRADTEVYVGGQGLVAFTFAYGAPD
jgi:hypothetical protein